MTLCEIILIDPVHSIEFLYKRFNASKVCARWMPRTLTAEMKRNHDQSEEASYRKLVNLAR